eukprot:g7473.t1
MDSLRPRAAELFSSSPEVLDRWAADHRKAGIDAHIQLCHFESHSIALAESDADREQQALLLVLGAIPADAAAETARELAKIDAAASDVLFETGVVQSDQCPLSPLALRRAHSAVLRPARSPDADSDSDGEAPALQGPGEEADGGRPACAHWRLAGTGAAHVLLLRHAALLPMCLDTADTDNDADTDAGTDAAEAGARGGGRWSGGR